MYCEQWGHFFFLAGFFSNSELQYGHFGGELFCEVLGEGFGPLDGEVLGGDFGPLVLNSLLKKDMVPPFPPNKKAKSPLKVTRLIILDALHSVSPNRCFCLVFKPSDLCNKNDTEPTSNKQQNK
jgi:hypothetical protein